jgi:hypothetical protein
MLWLIGIASVWSLSCLMAVALCVAARRGDDLGVLVLAVDETPPPVMPAER